MNVECGYKLLTNSSKFILHDQALVKHGGGAGGDGVGGNVGGGDGQGDVCQGLEAEDLHSEEEV